MKNELKLQIFSSRWGFSLVEVMISASILAGLSLVIMQLVKDTTVTTKRFEASAEVTTIMSNINQILLDHDACKNTFQGVDISNETTITDVRNTVGIGGSPVFSVGNEYGNRALEIVAFDIKDIQLNAVPAPSTEKYGTFYLEVTFDKINRFLEGSTQVTKKTFIQVRTDSNDVILNCHSHESNAIESAMAKSCKALEGNLDLVSGKCILSPYRDPNQDLESMGISESYINDLLMIGSGLDGSLTIGDSPGDMLIFETPITANSNITISDGNILTMSSDERLKADIVEITDALKHIESLRGVRFNWRHNGRPAIGFIAQEVEKTLPELVRYDREGHLSVDYLSVNAVLLQALKEVKEKLDKSEERYKSLESRIKNLEKRQGSE